MEEMIDIVDDLDRPVRVAPRSDVVKYALLHRCAYVMILNSKGEVVLQKRSASKKLFPGMWDLGVAETVRAGESYENAALRGLKEELGISGVETAFLFDVKYRSMEENVNYRVFRAVFSGHLQVNESELEDAGFFEVSDVRMIVERQPFVPAGIAVFSELIRRRLLNIREQGRNENGRTD